MDIVDRIDVLAKQKGWSRSEVLRQIGLQPAAASDWRKGKSSPEKHINNLANVLETTPEYLRGEVDDPSHGNEDDPPITYEVRKLSRDIQEIRDSNPQNYELIKGFLATLKKAGDDAKKAAEQEKMDD